jgi:hypothetical protein
VPSCTSANIPTCSPRRARQTPSGCAQALRQAGLATIDAHLTRDLARLDADYEARAEAQRERLSGELAEARAEHRRRVLELEDLLAEEMDKVVGGVFKGPRYQEIQARLERARAHAEATSHAADPNARYPEAA